MMLIFLIVETTHFETVRTISSIFNSTGRIEQVLVTVESIQRLLRYFIECRSYFLDKSMYVLGTSPDKAVESYQKTAHDVISLLYDVYNIYQLDRIPRLYWI